MKRIWIAVALSILMSVTFLSCDNKDGPVDEETPVVDEPVASDPEDEPKPSEDGRATEEWIFPVSFGSTRLSLDEGQMKNIDPANEFTFGLLRKVYKKGDDVLLSPLGIHTTLAMAGNHDMDGAAFCEMLGFEGDDIDAVNGYFKCLIGDLSGERCEKEFKFSNGYLADIWAMKYPQEYIDALKEYYFADYVVFEAKSLGEQPVGSRPEDLWCREKTDGMIDSAPFPIEQAESSLLNAICFKGAWAEPFKKELTSPGQFFVDPEKSLTLPMMHMTERFIYYKDDTFRSVSMPFGKGAFDLEILLPSPRFDVLGLLDSLNSTTWAKMRKGVVSKKLELSVPSFNTTYSIEFPLASFINDRDGKLAQIITFMMDEDGASAAAVTQEKVSIAPETPEQIESFQADSPFVYAISESGSGLILFIGVFSGGS